jgi:hypothetical protein
MLLLRLNKAAPLTNAELDNNLIYLDDRCTSLESTKLTAIDLLAQIKFIGGLGSGIDADKLDGMDATPSSLFSTVVARDTAGNFSANVITATLVGNATSANSATTLNGIVNIANGGTGATTITHGYVKSDGAVLTGTPFVGGGDVVGDISGNATNVNGVVSIANGGTGSTTANVARTNLGLVIGQTVQPYSSNLQMLSGVSTSGLLMFGSGIITTRQITVGNCMLITNQDGVSGNPTISITTVDIAHGGTGANTSSGACQSIGAVRDVDGVLNGIPTAPTAAIGTNTNQLATCSFAINNSVPTGTKLVIVGNVVPPGYLAMNGAQVLRNTYYALFTLCGTYFGSGNGSSTFNLPTDVAPVGFISVIKI